MPNQRFKSENYSNLGGMNTKASAYLTGPTEFLSIYNYDFSVPGSLTKRPGSTQYLGQTFAGKITGLFEFEKLDGSSYITVGATGGFWFGSTNGTLSGLSLTSNVFLATMVTHVGITFQADMVTLYSGLGSTLNIQPLSSNYNGSFSYSTNSMTFGASVGWWFKGAYVDFTNTSTPQQRKTDYINPISFNSSSRYDFSAFQNNGYIANGNNILRFDGSAFYRYQLPEAKALNCYLTGRQSLLGTFPTGFNYYFMGQYVGNDGHVGPLGVLGGFDYTLNGATASGYFGSFTICQIDVLTPPDLGISAINLYMAIGPTAAAFGSSFIPYFSTQIPASTLPITSFVIFGATFIEAQPFVDTGKNWALGATLRKAPLLVNATYRGENFLSVLYGQGDWPTFLELHSNRMFMAGFSRDPSTIWFSELADAEAIDPVNSIEVRTNDGDKITGLRAYQNSLMIFKNRSFHQLSGDSPDNFDLREMSINYGCVNNFSSCTWQQRLWFLDKKGIMEYNGASFDIVSNKIESIFSSMNLAAVATEAFMIHVKNRNEVWTAIPINGSSTNNCLVVYDYLVGAWAIWDGFSPSYLAIIKQGLTKEAPFFGDNSGRVGLFQSGIYSDLGATTAQGISCTVKSRYEHPEGNSVEKQFRRTFINADALAAGTTVFGVTLNLYKNYSASLVQSFWVTQSSFQTYTNFGVSSKSLAIEIGHFSATDGIRLHGYTLEYRYQRAV